MGKSALAVSASLDKSPSMATLSSSFVGKAWRSGFLQGPYLPARLASHPRVLQKKGHIFVRGVGGLSFLSFPCFSFFSFSLALLL